jgi:hypothetical protein
VLLRAMQRARRGHSVSSTEARAAAGGLKGQRMRRSDLQSAQQGVVVTRLMLTKQGLVRSPDVTPERTGSQEEKEPQE